MARWGKADLKQLQELGARLEKLQSIDLDKFCEDASKELAARLLALVIPRTPVGDYATETGKNGGTLQRGWTAENMSLTKSGSYYIVRVVNPVKYASYVEFGHRQTPGRFVPAIGKQLKSGWVDGRYFLTLSEEKLERIAPAILQKRLEKFLREAFGD